MKRELKITLAAAFMMLAVSPCFAASKSKKSKTKVRIINVAHTVTNVPYDFLDEKGNADGFEIAVLKAVDELLPEYEFKFHNSFNPRFFIRSKISRFNIFCWNLIFKISFLGFKNLHSSF